MGFPSEANDSPEAAPSSVKDLVTAYGNLLVMGNLDSTLRGGKTFVISSRSEYRTIIKLRRLLGSSNPPNTNLVCGGGLIFAANDRAGFIQTMMGHLVAADAQSRRRSAAGKTFTSLWQIRRPNRVASGSSSEHRSNRHGETY